MEAKIPEAFESDASSSFISPTQTIGMQPICRSKAAEDADSRLAGMHLQLVRQANRLGLRLCVSGRAPRLAFDNAENLVSDARSELL